MIHIEPKNTELPELMTVAELMEYLKCSKDRAYELVQHKDFPSMQLGTRWYVVKNDLPEWIHKQTRKMTFAK